MNTATNEAVALLKELIAVPSFSREETAAADKIADFIGKKAMNMQRVGNNVFSVCRDFADNKPTLLLDAHIDTVKVAKGWNHDPFTPVVEDGNLYGLGSNDDGGSLVSLLEAYIAMCDEKRNYNLVFSASCEEEVSGKGGIELALNSFPRIDAGIIGEPTGLKAATSERGLLVIDAVAEGKSGHAARNEGINALYIALDDIAAIRSHKFSRISPTMGEVHKTVTILHSGTAHNVVPDRCEFTIDIRPTEVYTCAEILDELQSICKSRLKARNLNNRSSATRSGSPLFKALDGLGIEKFSSPTTSDWMRIDSDCVKIGPGESSRSHKSDEFITVEEVQNGIETYINLIGELAKLF